MDHTIKLSQLLLSFFSLLIIIITAWVNISSRIAIMETQQQNDNEFKIEVRNYFKELSDGQTLMMIKLENKKNRD